MQMMCRCRLPFANDPYPAYCAGVLVYSAAHRVWIPGLDPPVCVQAGNFKSRGANLPFSRLARRFATLQGLRQNQLFEFFGPLAVEAPTFLRGDRPPVG